MASPLEQRGGRHWNERSGRKDRRLAVGHHGRPTVLGEEHAAEGVGVTLCSEHVRIRALDRLVEARVVLNRDEMSVGRGHALKEASVNIGFEDIGGVAA